MLNLTAPIRTIYNSEEDKKKGEGIRTLELHALQFYERFNPHGKPRLTWAPGTALAAAGPRYRITEGCAAVLGLLLDQVWEAEHRLPLPTSSAVVWRFTLCSSRPIKAKDYQCFNMFRLPESPSKEFACWVVYQLGVTSNRFPPVRYLYLAPHFDAWPSMLSNSIVTVVAEVVEVIEIQKEN